MMRCREANAECRIKNAELKAAPFLFVWMNKAGRIILKFIIDCLSVLLFFSFVNFLKQNKYPW
jgi:hypothetical protein